MSEFHPWKADMSETKPVTAHQYAPITRLDTEPCGQPATPEIRAEALSSALRGVDLGRYDHTIIGRLAQLDDLTIRTLVSLIERARTATHDNTTRRQLEHWCRTDAGVTGTPLAVLLALTTFADDHGANASPSTNELAAKTGRGTRTVTQAIQTLTQTGIIQSEVMAPCDLAARGEASPLAGQALSPDRAGPEWVGTAALSAPD